MIGRVTTAGRHVDPAGIVIVISRVGDHRGLRVGRLIVRSGVMIGRVTTAGRHVDPAGIVIVISRVGDHRGLRVGRLIVRSGAMIGRVTTVGRHDAGKVVRRSNAARFWGLRGRHRRRNVAAGQQKGCRRAVASRPDNAWAD